MNLKEMQNRVYEYSKKCEKQYIGGEVYFNELDRLIKYDTELLCSYLIYVASKENNTNFVISGEIGQVILKCKHEGMLPSHFQILTLSGSLRLGAPVIQMNQEMIASQFIFIDDSFYSGKTLDRVKEFIEINGGKISTCYVFYDGGKNRCNIVHSLFRYY